MKILIIGPSWVGDMVMAQTLFMAIQQQHPKAQIDVLAPDWSRPILQRMPQVNEAISMPIGHGPLRFTERRRLGLSLKRRGYDQAIILPNSLKSALIPFFAAISQRTGWRGEMRFGLVNDIRLLNKNKYPLMVQRFVALAYPPNTPLPQPLPAPQLVVDQHNLADALARFQLNTERPVLALCPGAEFGPAKRWPAEHYTAIAQDRLDRGWQVWLFGSEKDQPITAQIFAGLNAQQQHHCINLAGATRLADAVDLMSLATAVVSNDSGLMHIAAALERPLVVLYGSSSPDFTPPLNREVKILRTGISCSPCFKRECPLSHLKCLRELPPHRVLQNLDQLLQPAANRH